MTTSTDTQTTYTINYGCAKGLSFFYIKNIPRSLLLDIYF